MWSDGVEPQLLMPLSNVDDKGLLHQIIDANQAEIFRVLKEQYPVNKNQGSFFLNMQWVGLQSSYMENGSITQE